MGDEERRKKIQDHYAGKVEKYRTGPSSEDVWEVREEKVEGAFEGDLEAAEREIMEMEGKENAGLQTS